MAREVGENASSVGLGSFSWFARGGEQNTSDPKESVETIKTARSRVVVN